MTTTQGLQAVTDVLLLEGQSDLHVVRHILELYKIGVGFDPDTIEYRDMKGLPELIDGIDNAVDSYEKVGIVVDANSDYQCRWDLVGERLSTVGITLPDSPERDGVVITSGNRAPKIGIWLMPDNESSGELEDFVYEMIPKEEPDKDPVWPRAQAYIDAIPEQERKFDSTKVRKAEVHAWLAARKKPGLMGMAGAAGDLETSGHLCQRFIAWMQRLYS